MITTNETNQLLVKLDNLIKRQDVFSKEINELREEIKQLKAVEIPIVEEIKQEFVIAPPIPKIKLEVKKEVILIDEKPKIKSDIEKFIGENLINKIGIAITIIGVAIGAKYSIEHDLISPLTRIIFGYLMGIGLLGFGIKLKANYPSYSAVLVSGAIAILYFITYAAYSFYDLIPQVFAFALMVVFTGFTVVAAINYNKQVIAHIGLVGAYGVPFLLSDGSGKVAVLFSYMAIINIGVLFIAFKKYWKELYYSSFLLTWIIFFACFSQYNDDDVAKYFGLSLIFLSIFFATFYLMFLAYKLIQKEEFGAENVILLVLNSAIFYFLGCLILATNEIGEQLLGLFTLFNGVIHFIVCSIIYKQKLVDKKMFSLLAGLVLVFITIAVPVQLDGNWVTLIWAFEAALLFWIGRTQNASIYENLSYPLMFLAFFSLIQDWGIVYGNYDITHYQPIFNINFLTSALFIGAFAFINYINSKPKYIPLDVSINKQTPIMQFAIPSILLGVLYFSFRLELSEYIVSENLRIIRVINYSLLFFSILSFVNIKKLKNRNLGIVNISLNVFFIFTFLIQGLYVLSDLREFYLNPQYAESDFNIGIRYICYLLVALSLVATYHYIKQEFLKPIFPKLQIAFELLLHGAVLWIASSELINLMELTKSSESYRFGLSLLWGAYALFLIVFGIWKNKKHLRIFAIGLFAVILLKLFFYDIAHLDTIAKTICFVCLGILLLVISFLYNKFKHLISEENED